MREGRRVEMGAVCVSASKASDPVPWEARSFRANVVIVHLVCRKGSRGSREACIGSKLLHAF